MKVMMVRRREGLANFSQQINTIFNDDFFARTFDTIRRYPRSTILHNCIKQLIIDCLKENIIQAEYFLKSDSPYLNTFVEWLPREKKRTVPFGPQCYHILSEIYKKEGWSEGELFQLIVVQRKRRETLIGGSDAHKMHDCLRESGNNQSSSSQEFIEIDIPSQNSCSLSIQQHTNNSNHSLRLNKPASIERNYLQEQKIVIEGAEDSDHD